MKFVFLLLVFVACSLNKKTNERAQGHYRLYSAPEAEELSALAKNEKRLVIVATNDLKGQLEARTLEASDKHSPEKTLIPVGGAEIFARYMEILRQKHPNGLFLVDAGNSLSGTLISRASGARSVLQFFQELRFDAIGLSLEDLAAGPGLKLPLSPRAWMPDLFRGDKLPVVVSNLIDLKTTAPVEWGQTTAQLLKSVNGVQVGVVGLLADELPTKLDAGVLNGLYVEPALQAFLKQTRSLRLKGAEVLVLLMHGGIKCGVKRAEERSLPVSKVNFDPRDPEACASESAVARFISQLPPGSVDVVITGGANQKVANFINGIPVIQAMGQGGSFARVDLVWDSDKKALDAEKTQIHQPVMLCRRFFKASEDCYTEDTTIDHRLITPARFLGEEVFPDAKTALWMNDWRQEMGRHHRPILDHDNPSLVLESVSQAILNMNVADAAVVGGINWRLALPKGVTTWKDLFSQKNARESVQRLTLKGGDLATLRSSLQQVSWAHHLNWEILEAREQVTLLVNGSLASTIQKLAEVTLQEHMPMLVADGLVPWEVDSVNVGLSGRAPALPHTQP
jgi:5'-nucleotidase